MGEEGISHSTGVFDETIISLIGFSVYPYETSVSCFGKIYSEVIVSPSGLTRARYSPFESREKLVCNSELSWFLFLPLAKTIIIFWEAISMGGKTHFFLLALSSVKYHPPIFKVWFLVLVISIQSE